MTDKLRVPFLLIALVLILFAVIVEAGSAWKLAGAIPSGMNTDAPGQGIPSLAYLDGLLLFTFVLISLSLIAPEQIQGRIQGIVGLVFSILLIIGAFRMLLHVLALLILMVTLLLAPIFGTLAYFTAFSVFNTDGAHAVLRIAMTLKLFFGASLILAHQRFLQNKGLMLLIGTSLLATFLLQILQGWVPECLVNVTDSIGGLIALILALIWAVLYAISSVISIVKAII
jgi:hypothetical protein